MAREHEAVEFCLTLFEQPLHGRRDDAVAGKDREVLRRVCQHHRGNGRGRGLEADRDEDHFLVGLLGNLDGLVDALHDPDIATAGLEGPLRSRDMEEIAVGCDNAVLYRQGQGRHRSRPAE